MARTTVQKRIGRDITDLRRGWTISLRAANRADKTIKSYIEALDLFIAYLVAEGMPTRIDAITRVHVETFLGDQVDRWRPKTAQIRYGNLLQFFKWCVPDEIAVS